MRLTAHVWLAPWLVAFVLGLWTGFLTSSTTRHDDSVLDAPRSPVPVRPLKTGPIASRSQLSVPGLACDERVPVYQEPWEQITWYEPDMVCADVLENSPRRLHLGPPFCLPHMQGTPYLGPGVSLYQAPEETACR